MGFHGSGISEPASYDLMTISIRSVLIRKEIRAVQMSSELLCRANKT